MDAKLTHLQLVQGVINRLANNSFLLKAWSVVLVSGLFALAAKDSKPLFIFVAYLPCITFWALDAYFLWQERLFRSLYDHARTVAPDSVDFSMDTRPFLASTQSWSAAALSKTLLMFHGTVLTTIIVVMIIQAKM